MAVAYDTHTLKGETTGDSTWSHTAASSGVRGVLVYIATVDVNTTPVGVTYGGSAMTLIATAKDTATELGGAFAYWIGLDGNLQGTQTVSVDVGATQVWIGMAISHTASMGLSYVTGTQAENAANPSISLTAPHSGFVGYPSGAYYTGATAPLGAGSGFSEIGGVDSGNNAYAFLRYTTGTTTGNATVATAAAASDDLAFVAVLVGENVLATGIVAETDSALAPTVVSPITVAAGIIAEADEALAATVYQTQPGQTIETGIVAEADTALAATVLPGAVSVTTGIVSEVDEAIAASVASPISIAAGIVVEADEALAATAAPGVAVVECGIAVEGDAVLAATFVGALSVATGITAEVDEALPATVVTGGGSQSVTTGVVVETDAVLAATFAGSIGVVCGLVTETSEVLAATAVPGVFTAVTGVAAEVDEAIGVSASAPQTVVVGIVSESCSALSATVSAQITVEAGIAAEIDVSLAALAVYDQSIVCGFAAEVDAAIGLGGGAGSDVAYSSYGGSQIPASFVPFQPNAVSTVEDDEAIAAALVLLA